MAGEIQLNSTTMATESSGSITAQLDTIRPNTTNGSLTLQGDSSDAGVTGLTIDSSGHLSTTVTLASNINVALQGTGGISFSPNASSNLLNDYEEYSDSGSMGGSWSSAGQYNYRLVKVGDLISINFYAATTGTKSGSDGATITIPASYRPSATVGGVMVFSHNGNARISAVWTLTSAGTFTIYGGLVAGAALAAAAGCGFNEAQSVNYNIG